MRTLPQVVSTANLRSLEADWIRRCGGNWSQVLMEIAGRGAAQAAFQMWQRQPGPVAVVCGRGNNGGDGFVVARYLQLWGAPVSIFVVAHSESDETVTMSSPESTLNKQIAQELGIEIALVKDEFAAMLADKSLVVDALLGTGLDRNVEGLYKAAIDAINLSGITILSVDLPSGINSDTGQVMGAAIEAERTVTFGYLKPGLLQYPGTRLAGTLSVIDIGLPNIEPEQPIYLTTGDLVRNFLPFRPEDSHKGTFGSVLMVGGCAEMFGAAALAARSSLRSGAGLCLVAAPKSVVPHLPAAEMTYKMLPETNEGSIALAAVDLLEVELEKMSAVIIGPGLSRNSQTAAFVHNFLPLIAKSGLPCIIDADALNAIAIAPEKFPQAGGKFVLTPHPKELSRLMQCPVSEIQKDRIASARRAAAKFACTVVLKGARTVIADANGRASINPTGNPGMATAGCGDVLSGITGGLMAQGVQPHEAALLAVYIHGMAGDIVAQARGEAGIIAGDIEEAVPTALLQIHQGSISGLEAELLGFR